MEISNVHWVVLWGFLIAIAFGAIAHKTNFCTMGAVSDWVNMGDKNRLRAWFLATGVAVLGTQVLAAVTPIEIERSIYLTTNFGWLGHLIGGFAFGVGMTLGAGCGQRTLVRVGGGNLKSLVVFLVLAITAYMTLRGLIAPLRINVIEAANVDLSAHAFPNQGIDSVIAAVLGLEPGAVLHWIVTGVIGFGFVLFALASREFRHSFDNLLAGVSIGAIIVAGWYITGVVGFDEFEPVRLESYTFVAPVAESLNYLMTFTGSTLGFGVASVFGVILGSFLYAIAAGRFRIETFTVRADMIGHIAGGALMGVGGVLALGCTVGQGVTGMSTLAVGSVLTLVSIIFGAALTMKVQYYMLDELGFWRALRLACSDLRLLPAPGKPKAA